jgi:hypothetical protein
MCSGESEHFLPSFEQSSSRSIIYARLTAIEIVKTVLLFSGLADGSQKAGVCEACQQIDLFPRIQDKDREEEQTEIDW